MCFAAFISQAALAQQTTTTPAPAPAKKSCCAAGAEKSGKSCCAAGTSQKAAACTPSGTADATSAPAPMHGMVKKVAVTSSAIQAAQFQVWGNCGMCKTTIEKAANSVAGVQSADWNVDTHQFTVQFDPAKTGADKIHQAIATAGYDTDQLKGDDAAYNNLHGCCQYERRKM